jgi:caffeoyl-CoA O-methyltransferase
MIIIDDKIEAYAADHSTSEPALVQELIRTTESELEYSEMLSGRLVGNLLQILVSVSKARRVLEVGTFTGYSALMMAEALPEEGELITCDMNERYAAIARSFFERSRHGAKIIPKIGDARKTLKELDGLFDFAYLDADKTAYPDYYELIIPLLRNGGLLVIDNVLWSGKVLQPEDEKSVIIDRLNKQIKADGRVNKVLLPIRDGVTIVLKK